MPIDLVTSPTYNEEDVDGDVSVLRGASTRLCLLFDEHGVEGHHQRDVEHTDEDEPVPDDLRDSVVQKDEPRVRHFLYLVLGDGVVAGEILEL